MKVTIFGSGYVGLVTGACLADAGNDVLCVDVDADEDRSASSGAKSRSTSPVSTQLIKRNFEKGRLQFTTDAEEGVATACSSSSPSARRPMKTAPPT